MFANECLCDSLCNIIVIPVDICIFYSSQNVARVLIFNCIGERDSRKLLAPLVVREC